ncbi:ABC transporter ATP-binding protein [Thiobacillus sp.]|uniref:ABC transporter ATP-binding protein n=1 Tax=Thiobacillus sp. TaxID=924 RepID=UPI0025DE5FA5|nr:ABC transporter ATP-binding protein [Thiobacillus sp.]
MGATDALGVVAKSDETSRTAMAPRPNEGRLSVQHVGKIYDPRGARVVAVQDASIEIEPGDFVAIVGPSGCGKSTLMNIIAGFDNVTEGQVLLDNQPLATVNMPPKPGSDRVVVFQNGALFPWKTVLENVMYGPVIQHMMTHAQAEERAMDLLAKCGGLDKVAACYPPQLSSGMQRRVEIVRALINEPKILLLDEPFRAMDTVSKTVMHQHLLEMYRVCRKTIVFITHDLEEAIYLADKVVVMTSRPGTIKSIIHVNLPRPRTPNMMLGAEYLALKAQAIAGVHEEAKKAFERGEREHA